MDKQGKQGEYLVIVYKDGVGGCVVKSTADPFEANRIADRFVSEHDEWGAMVAEVVNIRQPADSPR